jgi:ureidoacrylate peracid hydrolase
MHRFGTTKQGAAMKASAITIAAKPQPIEVDLAKTAVLVVDMQNDFGAEGGIFERSGIDISPIQRAVAPIQNVLAAAREAGVPIIFLKMGFRPDLSDLGPENAPFHAHHRGFAPGTSVQAPNGQPSRVLVRDTWNTEILPELAPKNSDTVVWKHRYSGFYETELDSVLKRLGVISLIVTGCTTSVCVESTVRDAMFRDYFCVLLGDCMAEPVGTHDASLALMQARFAWVTESKHFLLALQTAAAAPSR